MGKFKKQRKIKKIGSSSLKNTNLLIKIYVKFQAISLLFPAIQNCSLFSPLIVFLLYFLMLRVFGAISMAFLLFEPCEINIFADQYSFGHTPTSVTLSYNDLLIQSVTLILH